MANPINRLSTLLGISNSTYNQMLQQASQARAQTVYQQQMLQNSLSSTTTTFAPGIGQAIGGKGGSSMPNMPPPFGFDMEALRKNLFILTQTNKLLETQLAQAEETIAHLEIMLSEKNHG